MISAIFKKTYSENNKNLLNQIGLNVIFKGFSVVCSLLLVKVSLQYLGVSNYGIWVAISSFTAFFTFFDFGLGHGLRNQVTRAIASNKIQLAREYISTAYVIISSIVISLLVIFTSIFNFINWENVFNLKNNGFDINIIIFTIFISFFLMLVLRLIDTICFSLQDAFLPGFITFIYNLITLLVLFLISNCNSNKSLLTYTLVFCGIQILTILLFNIILFRKKYHQLIPSFKLYNHNLIKNIFGLGSKFFILQISGLIIYSTDSLIIIHLFEPKDVTIYNIAYKYFGMFTMISSLILGPLWSAITDAHEKSNMDWIKSVISKSLKIITLLSIFSIIAFLISDWVYEIWVGKEIIIPKKLSFCMMLFVISSMFLQVYSIFLNGIAKINIQLIVGAIFALINIPLCIFFAKYLHFGMTGIISVAFLGNSISLVILFFQYNKIIKNTAYGIWNR